MRIKELGRRAACSSHTIRYYERLGLLEPRRSPANHRVYGAADLERLRFVRACRAIGLSLAEAKRVLGLAGSRAGDCSAVSGLLARHSETLGVRIKELRRAKAKVDAIRSTCARGSVDRCLILASLRAG